MANPDRKWQNYVWNLDSNIHDSTYNPPKTQTQSHNEITNYLVCIRDLFELRNHIAVMKKV